MGKDTAMPLIEFNKPTQPKKVQPVGLEQGALNLAARLSKTPTSLLGAAENYLGQQNAPPIAAGSTTIRAVPSLRTSPLEKGLPGMDAANLKAYQTRTASQEALAPEAISAALPGGKLARVAKRAIPLAAAIGAGITASSRLPAQDTQPIGTPMLASHGPGTNTPLLASHGADLNQVAQPAVMPLSDQPAPPIQPKAAPIGVMSVQGGGSATIDAQGNINRDAAFNAANRADAIKNHGGIGGTLNVMTPEQDAAVSRQAQPIGDGAGDKWSFLEDGSASGAAKAGIARKLGFVPEDYDRNASRYAAMITSQGAQYAQAENAIPVAQIGAAANNIIAPASAARHQAEADTLRAELPLVPDMQKSIIGKNVDEGMAKLAAASKTKAFDRAKALEENLRITKGDPQAATTLTQQQEYLSNGVGHVIPPQKTVINSENGEPMPYVVSGVIHKENYPQYKSLMDQWANEVKTYNSKRPGALLGIGSGGRDDAYNAHAQRRERILNGLRSLGVTVNPDEQPLQG